MRPTITVINGSLGGKNGNTGALLECLARELASHATLRELILSELPPPESVAQLLRTSQAFVFATGTYWDSWGSPLQIFLESMTETEGDETIWLGKPAAVIVSMNSVGGKGVLSRLQGVLGTLGCLIPPMSGLVYSLAGHLALQGEQKSPRSQSGDFWRPEDLKVIAHNLLEAIGSEKAWKAWPVDAQDFKGRWFFN